MKYKRVVVSKIGGPEVLKLIDEDLPEPNKGEVRVKVLAAGVASGDAFRRSMGSFTPPFTIGYDVAGMVDAVGEGVDSLSEGQLVTGLAITPPADQTRGGYAEYVCLPETRLIPVPEGVDPVDAACLPLNYNTAYSSLLMTEPIPGGRLLVLGASGGVGTAALQLGKFFGLEMYGTASTEKLDVVRSLGAVPIDYKKEDFVERIRELTNGEGVDAVLNGAAGDSTERAHGLLREGGGMTLFGYTSYSKSDWEEPNKYEEEMALLEKLDKQSEDKRVGAYDIAEVWGAGHIAYREKLTRLVQLLTEGHIKPVIHERIPLEEVVYAHELYERGGVTGKLVLIPGH